MHTGQTEATSGNKGLNMKNVQWTAQIISQSVPSHANQNFPIRLTVLVYWKKKAAFIMHLISYFYLTPRNTS